jgi:polyisoprenyl-teichoic acid--peptidoglycan teichoic acid transferase
MATRPRPPLLARALATSFGLAIVVASCGTAPTPSPSATPSLASPSTPASASASAPPPAIASATPSATASAAPTEAPPLGSERLNVLLVGFDNTTEREHSELTDSLIVASLDPVGQTVSLLALPRDLTDFPLPSGAIYREKLNSVYTEIKARPTRFGGKAGDDPLDVLAGVVGGIADVPIDGWASVDMDGFAKLIDALGGVDAYVDKRICDPGYHQLGIHGFEAAAGWWHLTGPQALGLARVRHNLGGSDFQRARRQMSLLVGIRDRILAKGAEKDPLAWIEKVPTIRTNLSPQTIMAAGAMVAAIKGDGFRRRVIEPGDGNGGVEAYDSRGYVLKAQIDDIRHIARLLFSAPGSRPGTGAFPATPAKPSTAKKLPRFNGC